ncbi:MAG: ABC transporter permease subunit [Planctomycetota bacterium]
MGGRGLAGTALAVAGKEIRTGLRDRQAVVYTVLLPLAMYPVLFWVMLQGFLVMQGERERTEVRLASGLAGERSRVEEALIEPSAEVPAGPATLDWHEQPWTRDDATEALRAAELDGYLAQPEDGGIEILFDGSKSRSALASERAEQRLSNLVTVLRVEAAGGDPDALLPYTVDYVDVASSEEQSAFVLSLLLPMMFCVMVVLGAFFPAIDLTAGEKERGTAETTLLLPVPRLGVLLGKLLAVCAFALAATVLNLAGLLVAGEHLLAGMAQAGGDAGIAFDIPWGAFPRAAPLLLIFLVSTSALLLAVASLANTFKQGQSLLGGVQMLILVPTVLASLPGIELTPALALVPVAQTALAFKGILQSNAATLDLMLVAGSQLVYTALALALALRLGRSEALSLGSGEPLRLPALLRGGGAPK